MVFTFSGSKSWPATHDFATLICKRQKHRNVVSNITLYEFQIPAKLLQNLSSDGEPIWIEDNVRK